ncbi:ATP synthase assembly protein Atp10, partial [Naegleria gruberi]
MFKNSNTFIQHHLRSIAVHHKQQKYYRFGLGLIQSNNNLSLNNNQCRYFLKNIFGGDNKLKEEVEKERERLSKHLKNERDNIQSEIHRYSPLKEIKSVLKHKGKLFVSMSGQLIPLEKSTVFPSPEVILGDGRNKAVIKNINGEQVDLVKKIKQCRATLLFVNFTEYGSNMTKEWKEAYEEFQTQYETSSPSSSVNKTQCIDLSISENYVVSWLESYVTKNLKSVVPEKMHANTLLTFLKNNNETFKFKDAVEITNSKTCYVFVIDQQCRIRWRGCGSPEGKEKDFMISAIQQLLTQRIQ